MRYSHILILITLAIGICENAVIPNAFLSPEKQTSSNPGLYSESDKVVVLNATSLNQNVYDQDHATEVEFYNSFCGFCKRFAPVYKKYAADLNGWSDIIKIAAIDCAAEENSDRCREFEIMAYPSLRYFPPHYKHGDKQLGINVDHVPMEVGHDSLIGHMVSEEMPPSKWPRLKPLPISDLSAIFDDEIDDVQYMFIVNELQNQTTIAQDVTLDFHKTKAVSVRQVVSVDVANRLGLPLETGLFVISRDTKELQRLDAQLLNRQTVSDTITNYMKSKHLELAETAARSSVVSSSTAASIPDISEEIQQLQNKAIVEQVIRNDDAKYQADIEAAIKYAVFHELVQKNTFNEESFIALQRFVNILQKYAPLGENGHKFLVDLNTYVINADNSMTGEQLKHKIDELNTKWQPIFSSKRWVGCQGSAPGFRGFTCGLWTLFHFITVQAAQTDTTSDPLESLRAIHGYVKNFFGCSECSEHFQTMASKNHIWDVSDKNDAIIWLWNGHNEVNQRLSGDATEDPMFPKIQYPSVSACSECRHSNGTGHIPDWNQPAVLTYLKRIHSPTNLNRLGVDTESVLPENLDNSRNKRQIGSVISDNDIIMGLSLYACCMGMIVLAVKLFLKRGYRKKLYMHDILGKV